MHYTKGEQTKEYLFQTAKHLMYLHGYKKTTYSMIAQKAGVPTGLVNYYFKKQELLSRIYLDYFSAINDCITLQASKKIKNALQRNILLSRIMLTNIFYDRLTLDFHLSVTKENLLPLEVHDYIRVRQVSIMEYLKIEMMPQYYYWCSTAEYGARRELIEQNKEISVYSEEFLDLVNLLSTITVRIAGLPPTIVEDNLAAANTIYGTMQTEHIRLFEPHV